MSSRTGYFYKRGGTGGGWKRRYFVLEECKLKYFKSEECSKLKGVIDLTEGRGVREKNQCKVEWPDDAKENLCFGLATKSRTFYIYATDMTSVQDWVIEIQQRIEKVGEATEDWKSDVEGKPESKVSKVVRNTVVLVSKISKKAISNSGVLSEDQMAVVEAGANAVENQASADPNTSIKDRVKTGVKDGAGVAGNGLNVASEYVPDQYGQAAVSLVGGVLVDQSEAEDLSMKQRLVLAGGSTIQGASGFAGDIQPLADTLEVAGGVVKDQAEADEDTDWKQRVALAAGSAATGVGELESLQGNEIAQTVTEIVSTAAEAAQEVLEEEEEEENF